MRVAVFQSDTAGQTPQQRLVGLKKAATDADAGLLLCPELFMSGYALVQDIKRFAESADGWFATEIARIARETGTALVYGYPEMADGNLYNAAQVIEATGHRLANHRKLVIPPGRESGLFTHGTGLTLFEIDRLKFAVLICYDAEFPETVRAAAQAGAEVVLAPTALKKQWPVVAEQVIPARAFENGLYLLYANHAGREGDITYLGASCIVGPDGKDIQRAGKDQTVLSADVHRSYVNKAREKLPYLDDVDMLQERLLQPD